MILKIKSFIRENQLLSEGDRVLVALSGGADSVCLLSILLALKDEYSFSLAAVHVNHNLRGDEADADAAFCTALCEKLGVRLHSCSADVQSLAREKRLSIEAAAREARYRIFYSLCEQNGYSKIAVAHNAQDSAETVLMHLLRGSGLDGLRGILPKRDNVIRPLLCVTRDEIEGYLTDGGLSYVTDSTNAEDVYLRNRIRHDLLPKLVDEYNPNLIQTLLQTVTLLQKDAQCLDALAQSCEEQSLRREGDFCLINTANYPKEQAVSFRIIRKAIAMCIGKTQDIPFDTVLRCDALCRVGQVGRTVDLPMGYCVTLEQDGYLVLCKRDAVEPYLYFIGDALPYVLELPNGTLTLELAESGKDTADCVYFDLDKISGGLCVRNRRQGDALSLKGMGGRKKLKEFFIDAKIPKHLRDTLPLLCCDDGKTILWVCGKRKCVGYDMDENTAKVIKCTFRGANRHEIQ